MLGLTRNLMVGLHKIGAALFKGYLFMYSKPESWKGPPRQDSGGFSFLLMQEAPTSADDNYHFAN
jgi:hypothetical protein